MSCKDQITQKVEGGEGEKTHEKEGKRNQKKKEEQKHKSKEGGKFPRVMVDLLCCFFRKQKNTNNEIERKTFSTAPFHKKKKCCQWNVIEISFFLPNGMKFVVLFVCCWI